KSGPGHQLSAFDRWNRRATTNPSPLTSPAGAGEVRELRTLPQAQGRSHQFVGSVGQFHGLALQVSTPVPCCIFAQLYERPGVIQQSQHQPAAAVQVPSSSSAADASSGRIEITMRTRDAIATKALNVTTPFLRSI